MKEVEITIEKIQRVAKSFEVPDSVYEEIQRTNRIPDDYLNLMEEAIDESIDDCEIDYAVWSETEQKQLIEWEN